MKRIVLLSAIVLSSVSIVSCKQEKATSKIKKENVLNAEKRDSNIKEGPKVKFDKEEEDFGKVNEGDVLETTFNVTNIGKTDLLILDAKTTCGCTIPVWPKEPITPGASKEVKVKFNTRGKKGSQTKTITLTTNTENGREMVKIKAMVTPKDKTKA